MFQSKYKKLTLGEAPFPITDLPCRASEKLSVSINEVL